MDEAQRARGVPAANVVYDNSTAILVGDLLFGKASELVAGLGAEAVLIQAQTFVRLCAGQIRDDRGPRRGRRPGRLLPRRARRQDGCRSSPRPAATASMFCGGDDATAMLMRDYGEKVGIAFQLADDLIDIASDADDTGKIPGTDLREGVDTLAVLRGQGVDRPADARLLELLHADLSDDDAGVAEALALLRVHPALEQARERDVCRRPRCPGAARPAPASDAKAALQALALSVVDRVG